MSNVMEPLPLPGYQWHRQADLGRDQDDWGGPRKALRGDQLEALAAILWDGMGRKERSALVARLHKDRDESLADWVRLTGCTATAKRLGKFQGQSITFDY